jgi:hypothetical protein
VEVVKDSSDPRLEDISGKRGLKIEDKSGMYRYDLKYFFACGFDLIIMASSFQLRLDDAFAKMLRGHLFLLLFFICG